MRRLVLAAILATVATPVLADAAWTATPATAAAENGFVAASVVWNCSGAACTSTSDTSGASEMPVCKALAAEVGSLTAFSGASGPFNAERLARCNKSAKPKS